MPTSRPPPNRCARGRRRIQKRPGDYPRARGRRRPGVRADSRGDAERCSSHAPDGGSRLPDAHPGSRKLRAVARVDCQRLSRARSRRSPSCSPFPTRTTSNGSLNASRPRSRPRLSRCRWVVGGGAGASHGGSAPGRAGPHASRGCCGPAPPGHGSRDDLALRPRGAGSPQGWKKGGASTLMHTANP